MRKLNFSISHPGFFWTIFLIDSITPLLLILSNIGYNILFLSQIVSILYLFNAFIVSVKNKLLINKISFLFVLFGFISIFIGVFYNNITFDNSRGSIFGILNPLLMMNTARVYLKNTSLELVDVHMQRVFKYYIPITIVLYFLYYYYHYVVQRYVYYGFQTNWQYASVYLLYSGKIILGLFGFFLVLISGKRATLITTLIPYITKIFSIKKIFKLKNILIFFFILIIIVSLFSYAYKEGYLRRFESTFEMNLSDSKSLSAGTSGRSDEVLLIIEELNEYKPFIFLGKGLGATYKVVGEDYTLEKNFSHIAPAHFSFQFGIIFTILLYYFFFQLTFKGFINHRDNIFYNFFLVVFIGSFFGGNLMVDPKTWFFIGLYFYYRKYYKKIYS